MASTGLQRSTGTPTSRRKFTFSAWVKKCNDNISDNQTLFCVTDNSVNQLDIRFHHASEQFSIIDYQDGTSMFLKTTRSYRDTSGFYHLVVAVDTTLATANDRIKIYTNGVEETSFSDRTNPSQNHDTAANQTYSKIGWQNSQYYFDGNMAHVHFCDGYTYTASTFGETDVTTGIWKPKTAPSVTYGNNGFFLKFENSGAMGTDSSGNSNNFSVSGGTMTQLIDTPSNVFATLNPLVYESRDNTFSNSNNTITGGGSDSWTNKYGTSTIAPSSGKYYVEAKLITKVSSQAIIGLISTSQAISGSLKDFGVFAVEAVGRLVGSGSDIQTGLTAISNGDIIGLAFDATNGTAQFYRNGSTYGNALTSIPSDTYYFATTTYSTGGVINFNFGNGKFGTTNVSSAQNPDDGIGIFEYSPPTGYKALCTKSINAQEYS